ncbi:MAG TPA: hypothetical protein PKM06_10455 [Bacillota bacterium]|nr:hypothetical protein [Peptococcaceae bacterium]HUM59633.1 hypothetical protein [Bacillota bacterium]
MTLAFENLTGEGTKEMTGEGDGTRLSACSLLLIIANLATPGGRGQLYHIRCFRKSNCLPGIL